LWAPGALSRARRGASISSPADAELKAFANLVTVKRALDQKVVELKKAGEAAF
jgi:hypothetical protein